MDNPNDQTVAAPMSDQALPKPAADPPTIEEFLKSASDSGIIKPGQIEQERKEAVDAEALAADLVAKGRLTEFQAEVLLKRAAGPLRLDRYVILDALDPGGMGLVYRALHQTMDRTVVLKMLPPGAVDSPDKVERFRREVKAAARLTHPNIVTAHDAAEADGTHFLVMEYVAGKDLNKIVAQDGPLSVAKAANYLIQAARGLHHAHQQGIVHRDVKPANLILDASGTVKVLDMGLARITHTNDTEKESATVAAGLTQAGTVMGTANYMAPEQAIDSTKADHRSDIYSLGCVFWYLLTGEPVYHGSTAMKTIMAHQQEAIPSLRDKRGDVSVEIDSVFQRMLAKDAADRYQSLTEVIESLRRAAGISGSETAAASPDADVPHIDPSDPARIPKELGNLRCDAKATHARIDELKGALRSAWFHDRLAFARGYGPMVYHALEGALVAAFIVLLALAYHVLTLLLGGPLSFLILIAGMIVVWATCVSDLGVKMAPQTVENDATRAELKRQTEKLQHIESRIIALEHHLESSAERMKLAEAIGDVGGLERESKELHSKIETLGRRLFSAWSKRVLSQARKHGPAAYWGIQAAFVAAIVLLPIGFIYFLERTTGRTFAVIVCAGIGFVIFLLRQAIVLRLSSDTREDRERKETLQKLQRQKSIVDEQIRWVKESQR